jgi:glutamate formiminotransferase
MNRSEDLPDSAAGVHARPARRPWAPRTAVANNINLKSDDLRLAQKNRALIREKGADFPHVRPSA